MMITGVMVNRPPTLVASIQPSVFRTAIEMRIVFNRRPHAPGGAEKTDEEVMGFNVGAPM